MLDENIHKINIIITYFRDLVNIKYSENTEISDICNQLEKNHTKLKIYLLDIETVVFSSDSYVNDRLAYIWNILKHIWLPTYNKIKTDDYKRLFDFFLLITHNIPYMPPHSDSCYPGCALLFKKSTFKRKYNESSHEISDAIHDLKKYKDTKLLCRTSINHIYNEIIPISKYMRIHQWINNDSKDEKKFGCVCENYF